MPRKLPLVRFKATVITSSETVESVIEVTEDATRTLETNKAKSLVYAFKLILSCEV